jgi:hypothetical protein
MKTFTIPKNIVFQSSHVLLLSPLHAETISQMLNMQMLKVRNNTHFLFAVILLLISVLDPVHS